LTAAERSAAVSLYVPKIHNPYMPIKQP